jgi:hypothetical protein
VEVAVVGALALGTIDGASMIRRSRRLSASQREQPVAPGGDDYDEAGGNPDRRVEPRGEDSDDVANETRRLGNRRHIADKVRADPRIPIKLKIGKPDYQR